MVTPEFDTLPLAWSDGHRTLYHWQRFDSVRLRALLLSNAIYCSRPTDFNDPWDCKPHFSTAHLNDPQQRVQHAAWAVDMCRRHTRMSNEDLAVMEHTLRTDPTQAATYVDQISAAMWPEIAQRYRVYCLGPDLGNLLMWSHYADHHRGLCLEFSLRNTVLCGALRCEYLPSFPVMSLEGGAVRDQLRILLAKAESWSYEKEYRLVAQERSEAIPDADTLLTDGGMLQLPAGALTAIIVGCQGDLAAVRSIVQECSSAVQVRQAQRVPNRYAVAVP